MARRRKQRRNRGSAKRSSSRKKPKTNPVVFQSIVAVVIVFATILLITLGVLTSTVGAVICVVLLGVIFYLMTTTQPRRVKRKRLSRPSPEEKVDSKEPKFYTALPSTLGVSETAQDSPKAQVNLPPRPIRAARRRRDFITYPLAVSGGDYSDSYVQVDKDTVLRFRSEMTPNAASTLVPGLRLPSFPSSKIAAVMSKEIVENPMPVPAETAIPYSEEISVNSVEAQPLEEGVAVEAQPLEEGVAVVTAQKAQLSQVSTTEEEVEFDMEWE